MQRIKNHLGLIIFSLVALLAIGGLVSQSRANSKVAKPVEPAAKLIAPFDLPAEQADKINLAIEAYKKAEAPLAAQRDMAMLLVFSELRQDYRAVQLEPAVGTPGKWRVVVKPAEEKK